MPGKGSSVWTGTEWASISPASAVGKSAYELAVEQGYSGTLTQWLNEANLGPIGPAGPQGPAGPAGPTGSPGIGLPTGGTTGQFLRKRSATNYDVEWVDAYSLVSGAGAGADDLVVPDGSITGGLTHTYIDSMNGWTYKVHRFLYTGDVNSLIVNEPVIGTILVVAGGGRGGGGDGNIGGGGGGGAGGFFTGAYAFGTGIHNLYVGRGGFSSIRYAFSQQRQGENSWIDHDLISGTGGILMFGGGAGGANGSSTTGPNERGYDGGSGGGCSEDNTTFGLGVPGQGNNGGAGSSNNGAAGGGAGGTGAVGGPGVASTITGTSVTYAQGGGTNLEARAQDTGSGSSASAGSATAPADGSNGIIICRYRIA